MSDTFNVTAAWSQTSYNVGQTMTGTISGTNTHTTSDTTVTETGGPVNIPVAASGGAQSTVNLPTVNVIRTIPGSTTTEQVTIDTTRPIVDSSATPRNWVVSADRKSISAVA
jgi:hypothetical protein